jgi:EAL domain-containing protein (putative c-di-GMP-specific phosphodiesterase class I)
MLTYGANVIGTLAGGFLAEALGTPLVVGASGASIVLTTVMVACAPAAPDLTEEERRTLEEEIASIQTEFTDAWREVEFDRGMSYFDDHPDFGFAFDAGTWNSVASMDRAFRPVFARFESQEIRVDERAFTLGASIGIAISPDFGADPDDLLRKADIALYEAKRSGRGRYQVFAGDMDDLLLRRRTVESDLRAALQTGDQIKLLYQPIYAEDCKTVLGAEALIRWDHPAHGALSPSHFVGIAEERGMIGMLGGWVLREACSFAATSDLPWLAVNVSPLQLRDENFAADLFAIMEAAGVEPSRIQLEITESVLLENTPATTAVLKELRGRGVQIALDDFGTGYSSLSYLHSFPLHKVKIDRSFLQGISTSERSRTLLCGVARLSRELGLSVTVEGVETDDELNLIMREAGVDEAQGYLFSPAIPSSGIRELLAKPALTANKVA